MDADKLSEMEARLNRITDLPTLPVVVLKVMEIVNRDDVSIQDIAKLVSADQVIASKIIRMVNSPFYGLRREITSLDQAMAMIGLDRVKSLVMTCSLISHLAGRGGAFNMKTFWEHSYGCGIVSKLIGEMIGLGNPEGLYLAGLVHDLGEVVLGSSFKQEFATILERAQTEGCSFYKAELEVLGYTHCDVGAWLGKKWHFPQELIEAMRTHHAPSRMSPFATTAAVVNLADLFCRLRNVGYGFFERLDVSFVDEPAWKMLKEKSPKLDELDLERFTYQLDEKMDDVHQLISAVY